MNAILGMTELVLDTPLTEEQRQCLETVGRRPTTCSASSTTCSTSPRSRPASSSWTRPTSRLRPRLGDTLRALAVRARDEGAGAGLPRAAGRTRRTGRRRGPAAAGAAQPGRQRHQVHRARARWSCAWKSPTARGRGGSRPALRGARHRHRHPAGQAGADLPGLRAGGHLDHAQVRRHRPGPDHRRPAGRP